MNFQISKVSILAIISTAGFAPAQWEGLQPAEEIGATTFRAEHPDADGRGTLIVILDTGIDPGAPGLQQTTTGEPKMIELLDATGSGDITLTKWERDGAEGKLALPENVATGETLWAGKLPAWDFFPLELVSRLKSERNHERNLAFATRQREVERALHEFDEKHPTIETDEQANRRVELSAQIDAVKSLTEHAEDSGPTYKCVAWFSEGWHVLIDTDNDSDLADESVLRPFGVAQEFATFPAPALLNFGVQVYGDNDADEVTLSVVFDCGMHGTHVAGIVGAHTPERPELDGIAPGAQLISIKIGDTRLDGMETPHALRRTANMIREIHAKKRIDLINMSYGEPTRTPDSGRLAETLIRLVDEDDIVFVSSAGNSGPALSTVGAPGGTSDAMIGVGAILTSSLMRDAYSMLEDIGETAYTWSSRGPTFDGSWGVDICSPGGAVSSVPTWELQRAMLAHGTSMASPNACGGIALALSALRSEGKAWRASDVKRAVENSARPIEGLDVWTQGRGMLQVGATYEALTEMPSLPRFDVEVVGGALRQDGRGIYLREVADTDHAQRFKVSVKPVFPEIGSEEMRAEFYLESRLECSADWVTSPENFILSGVDRIFSIGIDPTGLEFGENHAEVIAYAAGVPIFRVPITVLRPDPSLAMNWSQEWELAPGEVRRTFASVPDGAKWAKLTAEGIGLKQPVRMFAHSQQAFPGTNYHNVGTRTFLSIPVVGETEAYFPVRSGETMELTFAQFWNEQQRNRFKFSVRFGGLTLAKQTPVAFTGISSNEWQVSALAGEASLDPEATLESIRRTIAPNAAEIIALDDPRDLDRTPTGKPEFALNLTYAFELSEETEIRALLPGLNDYLYDSEFESQLQIIRDATGKSVATRDTFADPCTLSAGNFTLSLELRHSDHDRLGKLKKLPLHLDRKLESSISLPIAKTAAAALEGRSNFAGTTLLLGGSATFFIGGVEDLPAGARPGDRLVGKLTLERGKPQTIELTTIVAKSESQDEDDDAVVSDPNTEIKEALEALEEAPSEELTQAVISLINEGDIASYFGQNSDPGKNGTLQARKLHAAMAQKKKALFTAYSEQMKLSSDVPSAFKEAKKWGAPSRTLRLFAAKSVGNWGSVLKEIEEARKDGDLSEEDRTLRAKALAELGWSEFE